MKSDERRVTDFCWGYKRRSDCRIRESEENSVSLGKDARKLINGFHCVKYRPVGYAKAKRTSTNECPSNKIENRRKKAYLSQPRKRCEETEER